MHIIFLKILDSAVNLNSLVNKVNLVSNFLTDHSIEILMAVTESWLTANIPGSFLIFAGFHPIAQTDAVGNVHKHGVLPVQLAPLDMITVGNAG